MSIGEDRFVSRRRLLQGLAALGMSPVFARAVAAQVDGAPRVTPEMLANAEWIAGVEMSDKDRELMRNGVADLLDSYESNRRVDLDNSVVPWNGPPRPTNNAAPDRTITTAQPAKAAAVSGDDLAFAPVTHLADLIRRRQLSSVELTRFYLERLHRFDPQLECVITVTEKLALEQAEKADREIASGRYRGPLHGIPWGAKDLLALPGYLTTWGAKPYRGQMRKETATVIRRLEEAGAVLVAKLTLGALAWGDVWFGGKTKNPWNLEQGSSGSSAGSAAATAAGLAGFTIGTETWGSIVSPCTRCGATGLRPTFGRVSRFGAMALSWSMDKIGPITRSVEDCALVFNAIHGADGLDPTAVNAPFDWPVKRDVRTLRVGYVKALFDAEPEVDNEAMRARIQEQRDFDRRTLGVLRDLGVELVPIELPEKYPLESLGLILTAEAATAFDELTRSGRDDLLVRQIEQAWPNSFRQGQTIPAVEYLRANRIRTLVQEEMEEKIRDVDVYVTPSFGGNHLLLTNLTGHPSVVLPNGFRAGDGTPTSITFGGRLYGESEVLAVANAYQQATDFHLKRPPLEA